MNMGVCLPLADKNEAAVILEKSPYEVKTPCAPAPRAWTARSGTYMHGQIQNPGLVNRIDKSYPLMIETLDLLTEDEVLEQCWTTLADAQAVLVFNGTTHVGGHKRVIVVEVVMGHKLLRGGGSIIRCRITGVKLASHIRAGGIGETNKAREGQTKSTHLFVSSSFDVCVCVSDIQRRSE